MFDDIKINCHSSICLGGNIYVDPFKIENAPHNARLIFITHSHYDHLEIESIDKIKNDNTIIICTPDSEKILKNAKISNKIVIVKPNEHKIVDGVEFDTFPAYNVGHHHFRELNFVGYTLNIDNTKITICGDTDFTPELAKIKTDILLIPIGGTYTMDACEAANATNTIKPKLVIPTHYNTLVGTKADEKTFIQNVNKNIQVKILVN